MVQPTLSEHDNAPIAVSEGNAAKNAAEWAALGGLRFMLASIVFCTHIGAFVRLPFAVAHVADAGAFAAVLGFFVVSGYSIAASSAAKNEVFMNAALHVSTLFILSV